MHSAHLINNTCTCTSHRELLRLHISSRTQFQSPAGLRPEWGTVNRWGAKVPPALKALVESCWAADYDERPTFDEIVEVLEAELAK